MASACCETYASAEEAVGFWRVAKSLIKVGLLPINFQTIALQPGVWTFVPSLDIASTLQYGLSPELTMASADDAPQYYGEYYELQAPGPPVRIYHPPKMYQYGKDDRREMPDYRPLKNIAGYIEGKLDLAIAVENLTGPIERMHTGEGNGSTYSAIMGTWQTFNNVVEQVPPGHEAHQRLAELLIATQARRTDLEIEYSGKLWEDLPEYRPRSTGFFNSPTEWIQSIYDFNSDVDVYGGEDAISEQFTNQCAFLTRLIRFDALREKCESWALIALAGALEEDLSPRGLDLNVPGAAMWILYAGDHLLQCDQEWLDSRVSTRAHMIASGSFMWGTEKKKGFCRERWDLWRNSLAWVGDIEGVTVATREIAMRAADEMVRLEKELDTEPEPEQAQEEEVRI